MVKMLTESTAADTAIFAPLSEADVVRERTEAEYMAALELVKAARRARLLAREARCVGGGT